MKLVFALSLVLTVTLHPSLLAQELSPDKAQIEARYIVSSEEISLSLAGAAFVKVNQKKLESVISMGQSAPAATLKTLSQTFNKFLANRGIDNSPAPQFKLFSKPLPDQTIETGLRVQVKFKNTKSYTLELIKDEAGILVKGVEAFEALSATIKSLNATKIPSEQERAPAALPEGTVPSATGPSRTPGFSEIIPAPPSANPIR